MDKKKRGAHKGMFGSAINDFLTYQIEKGNLNKSCREDYDYTSENYQSIHKWYRRLKKKLNTYITIELNLTPTREHEKCSLFFYRILYLHLNQLHISAHYTDDCSRFLLVCMQNKTNHILFNTDFFSKFLQAFLDVTSEDYPLNDDIKKQIKNIEQTLSSSSCSSTDLSFAFRSFIEIFFSPEQASN